MGFDIKVVKLETKEDISAKGKYTYQQLDYEYKDQPGTMKIFSGTITRYPFLREDLSKVKAGMIIKIDKSDNGKGYKELSKITFSDQDLSGWINNYNQVGKTSTPQSSSFGSAGSQVAAQVGNAITNACSTLEKGATLRDIERRVWEIVLLGERTKKRIQNGEHIKDNAQPFNDPDMDDQAGNDMIDDEDVPF